MKPDHGNVNNLDLSVVLYTVATSIIKAGNLRLQEKL